MVFVDISVVGELNDAVVSRARWSTCT